MATPSEVAAAAGRGDRGGHSDGGSAAGKFQSLIASGHMSYMENRPRNHHHGGAGAGSSTGQRQEADDVGQDITFLFKFIPGAADRSFGLNVVCVVRVDHLYGTRERDSTSDLPLPLSALFASLLWGFYHAASPRTTGSNGAVTPAGPAPCPLSV